MKNFRNVAVTLGVALTIMTFSFGITAFADGSHGDPQTTAKEAYSANDESTMRDFVQHAETHMEEAVNAGSGVVSVLRRQMRTDAAWKHESVYLIEINESDVVKNHGIYTESLHGADLSNLPTVKSLRGELEKGTQEKPVCVEYGTEGSKKWSCAVEIQSALEKVVLIGGFDHEEKDPAIVPLSCPSYEPAVTAQQVNESQSEEDMKNFVKEAVERIGNLVQAGSGVGSQLDKVSCFGKGHWKSGSIYLFIMTKVATTGAPVVILNGNNPELTGSPFAGVLDEDGVDIGAEILKVAGEHGKGGVVKYKWDNPDIEGDEVSTPGMSPGTSPKISYVEGVTYSKKPGVVFIFGSGVYPQPQDDDGGCAIAGAGNTSRTTVFNLFLVVFSLGLAFGLKGRSEK